MPDAFSKPDSVNLVPCIIAGRHCTYLAPTGVVKATKSRPVAISAKYQYINAPRGPCGCCKKAKKCSRRDDQAAVRTDAKSRGGQQIFCNLSILRSVLASASTITLTELNCAFSSINWRGRMPRDKAHTVNLMDVINRA